MAVEICEFESDKLGYLGKITHQLWASVSFSKIRDGIRLIYLLDFLPFDNQSQ
jgi:hypothetical protein